MPASNVEREKEDGCMNKLKIERTNKLWQEDYKNRKNYSIINGVPKTEEVWLDSFGGQRHLLNA